MRPFGEEEDLVPLQRGAAVFREVLVALPRRIARNLTALILLSAPAVVCAQQPKAPPTNAAPVGSSPTHAALGALVTPQTLAERIGTLVLILLVSYVCYRVILGSLRKAMKAAQARAENLTGAARQRQQRAVTLIALLSNIVRWTITFLALIWALAALGINLVPVLTGVGFLGAAIAFGSQALVRDIVSGFFMLLEGQYTVGDYVELNGKFGMVQTVGLRTTVLRDTRNQIHHIPNGSITVCTVYEQHSVSYVLHVPLPDAADAEAAMQALEAAGEVARQQLPEYLLAAGPARIAPGADTFAEVVLPFSVFPTQEWVATTELPARAKAALTRAGITLPEGSTPYAQPDLSDMPVPPMEELRVEGKGTETPGPDSEEDQATGDEHA
ncbi:mechanosensitive ion channel family protein [bacterium]|nr:mechanosensitive ion channel family protein [bacterium]